MSLRLAILSAPLWMAAAHAADAYLFTSFRKNGEDGVYFALSRDGYRWTPLNGNRAWVKPQHPGMLMRDPFLTRGPDGVYHMLWTWGWRREAGDLRIGYASSRDLIQWSEQRVIPILPDQPTAANAWAPEMYYDKKQRHWLIFWSTAIPGKFGATDRRLNHRLYAMTTTDFWNFSLARLFLEPGFNCIDATILEEGGRFVLVFKDEREEPVRKNLRLAFADRAEGPYTGVTEPFTPSWVEGPSAIRIGKEYFVYFDYYRKPQHYGAMRSHDLKNWEEVTDKLSFPADHRHGTVIKIPERRAKQLESRSW